jgi:hypothetical protein
LTETCHLIGNVCIELSLLRLEIRDKDLDLSLSLVDLCLAFLNASLLLLQFLSGLHHKLILLLNQLHGLLSLLPSQPEPQAESACPHSSIC